jgi:purine-binding chemotaxis protein CheW
MNELRDHQFLTFSLDDGKFAIPIARVREVLLNTKITKLPRCGDSIKGIIDVRGHSVPVIDLRARLGMKTVDETTRTAIIVMDVAGQRGDEVMGAIADAVHEVVIIEDEAMEAVPAMGTKIDRNYIDRIGKKDGEFIIILDMDAAVAEGEAYGT